jgi:FKBP-type peptidyl-prolyl cis-trans isomerase 2
MNELIKKGDFIELNYTAKLTASDVVFDTTLEAVAKEHGLVNEENKDFKYAPLVACIGEGHLIKGLDDFVIGKTVGKYPVHVSSEDGFGKKNAKLLRLVSIREFHKNKIQPVPGLEVELDNNRGIVRTVNGGRVIVDFNHPLSSQELDYDIEILDIVQDEQKKIEGLLKILKVPFQKVAVEGAKAIITFGVDIPKELHAPITQEIARLTNIKDVEYK